MKIFIDADGCPVVDIAVRLGKDAGVDCVIICDTAHSIERDGTTTITVPKGNDSVDFKLVNMAQKGDLVITQDYALAAMCLARLAIPINQDGFVYDSGNIDSLLMQRHMAKKVRKSGGRIKGPAKRNQGQNKAFEEQLGKLLAERKTPNDSC